MLTQEQRVKKAHIALMKSKHTVWWGGVMMMGTTEVSDKEGLTAYTDGVQSQWHQDFKHQSQHALGQDDDWLGVCIEALWADVDGALTARCICIQFA